MRAGGLRDRIAQNLGNQPEAAQQQAKLLDELARALLETADTATAIRPAPSARELAERAGEPATGLPLILKSMPMRQPVTALHLVAPMQRSFNGNRGWLGSPLLLAAGVGGAALLALLLIVWPFGFGIEPGMEPRRSLVQPSATASPRSGMAPLPVPELSPADHALIEHSDALIEQGELKAAREMLTRAAADGSFAARFALAETFDPNMLAAWGSREQIADVGLARALYLQAKSAGDPRAARRIEALQGE